MYNGCLCARSYDLNQVPEPGERQTEKAFSQPPI